MIRLICVEDDPLVRTYLNSRLELERDFQLLESLPDAGSAFAYLSKNEVDVVLLDYQLGGIDGIHLAKAIAVWRAGSSNGADRPRVLFCTGYGGEDFEQMAREAGAAGVVPKADAPADLIPAIRAVAGGGSWYKESRGTPAPPAPTERKVLAAISERPARAQLNELLPQLGCSVTFAWNGEGVISLLERAQFDVLLLDERLPGPLGGVEVLEQIAERWPHLPVLFLTGRPEEFRHYTPTPNIRGVIARPPRLPQLQDQLSQAFDWGEGVRG
jgi:CheY-like chemotaxis protein